jgi:hypothetical protein
MRINVSKDALWKGIIEDLFEDFMLYFFPAWTMSEADFTQDFIFLDKELAEIVGNSGEGTRYADKLVQIRTKTGGIQWCLVHVEIQGYKDERFAERMYVYFSESERSTSKIY